MQNFGDIVKIIKKKGKKPLPKIGETLLCTVSRENSECSCSLPKQMVVSAKVKSFLLIYYTSLDISPLCRIVSLIEQLSFSFQI